MPEGRDLDEAAIVQAKLIVDATNKLASQDTEVEAAIKKRAAADARSDLAQFALLIGLAQTASA